MTDKQIIETVAECARVYRDNLEKYNIMFVFNNDKLNSKNKKVEFIETIYYPTNFLHLTGLKLNNDTSANFYYKIINGKLAINDINLKDKYIIEMKLNVLRNLMNIDKTAKSIGTYMETTKNKLYTDKVLGSVHYCFGYVKSNETNKFYTPNTALKEDIRDITYSTNRVLAILKKKRKDKLYNEISYLCNDFKMNNLFEDKNLIQLIDFHKLKTTNKKYENIINEIKENV